MVKENFFSNVYLHVLLFFFLFSPRFLGIIPFHSGMIAVAFLLAYVMIIKNNNFLLPKSLVLTASFFGGLAIYHLAFAFIYDNNAFDFFSICIAVVVYITFGWMLALFMDKKGTNSKELIDNILVISVVCAIFNSIVILIQYIYPEVRIAFESILVKSNGDIDHINHPFRLRGIASGGGSALSLFNSIMILFLIFLVKKNRVSASFALFGALTLSCSNIFTGRTGLIIGLIFTLILFFLILYKNLSIKNFDVRTILVFTLSSYAIYYLLTFDRWDAEVSTWAFEWVEGLYIGKFESSSTNALMSMLYLPDNPSHLLFGIGYFEGDGKIYLRTDSGYLKTLLSVGLPLSILVYGVIIFFFAKLIKASSDYFWLVFFVIITMLLVEIKEPVFYQNFSSRMILLLSGVAMFLTAKKNILKGKYV